jgi:mannose-6-phosphate isomerase-like protein (cupin superfamily)
MTEKEGTPNETTPHEPLEGPVQRAFTEPVLTEERCWIREHLNHPDVPEASLARARVTAGTTTRWHRVGVLECYVVHEGHGRMELAGAEPFPIGPGQSVRIDPLRPQRVTALGPGDLVFDCVCVPRFRPELYEDLGDGPEPADR